jgi:hypothetical protein
MSHQSEYVNQQSQLFKDDWFKDHKVAVTSQVPDLLNATWADALVIRFTNPKSWNYGCHFIIHRKWLTVVGDIGEATYEWSGDLTLNFLASLDFDYFFSKCVASESGKKFTDWKTKIAEAYVKDRIAEIKAMDPEDQGKDDKKELEILEDLGVGGDKSDYDSAAREYYDATGDGEGASAIAEYGDVPSGRCIGHYLGLKLAIEQLRANQTPG